MNCKALLITRDGLECFIHDVPDDCVMSMRYVRPCKTRLQFYSTCEYKPDSQIEMRVYETTRPDPGGVTIFYEL